jgi:hypothetical protein
MGRVRVQTQRTAAIERLLDAAKRLGLSRLEAILACTFTFDSSYFEQLLEALAACHPEGDDLLRGIPVDVVCDFRHYHGHTDRNVHTWHGDSLFHPKLILLLFADRVVWIEGSLNLTRAGYMTNQELASYHQSSRSLPHGVSELVRQLANQGVEAAKRIRNATANVRTEVQNRSVTSLDSALLDGFLGRVRKAHSVYLVAPFFDRREQAGPAIESAALQALAKSYPKAQFRIFLPELTRPDGTAALQGSKGLFTQVFGPRATEERLLFCGVPSNERPLHAKLLAVRHGNSGARVTVLTGSPNMTESALLKKGVRANVELARELSLRWKDIDQLLRPLGRKFKPLSECVFDPPLPIITSGWHALNSATYYPLRQKLELDWRRPEYARQTRLYYAGSELRVSANARASGLGIRNGELRLKSVCRENPARWSWCPIVIPYESRLALADLPEEGDPPPEWWLAQLGALPTVRSGERTGGQGMGTAPSDPETFALGQRVRDLAERMRYAMDAIRNDDSTGSNRAGAHLDLLERIFDAHEPAKVREPLEQAWRIWVRLEIAETVTLAIAGRRAGQGKARRLRAELKRRLSSTNVPKALSQQWQVLTNWLP